MLNNWKDAYCACRFIYSICIVIPVSKVIFIFYWFKVIWINEQNLCHINTPWRRDLSITPRNPELWAKYASFFLTTLKCPLSQHRQCCQRSIISFITSFNRQDNPMHGFWSFIWLETRPLFGLYLQYLSSLILSLPSLFLILQICYLSELVNLKRESLCYLWCLLHVGLEVLHVKEGGDNGDGARALPSLFLILPTAMFIDILTMRISAVFLCWKGM